jgi:YVTN family beta-propeller protein
MTENQQGVRPLKIFCSSLFSLLLVSSAVAQQAPFAKPNVPVFSHDRVYAADQTSNTVDVIDPSSNKSLGVIKLGDPVPASLAPLYKRGFAGAWPGLLAGFANACCSFYCVKFHNAD